MKDMVEALIRTAAAKHDLTDPKEVDNLCLLVQTEVAKRQRESYEQGRLRGKSELVVAIQEAISQHGR